MNWLFLFSSVEADGVTVSSKLSECSARNPYLPLPIRRSGHSESMLQQLLDVLKRVFTVLVLLLQIAVVGGMLWFLWPVYEEAALQRRFDQEGRIVRVRIDEVNFEQRTWLDAFQNAVYITFRHDTRLYTTRFLTDTVAVDKGQMVNVLYHPSLDAFRQPALSRPSAQLTVSRLVRWTIADDLSGANKLLSVLVVLAVVLFFLVSGLINYLIPVPTLQWLSKLALFATLFGVAAFITYDAAGRYQYWNRLRATSQPDEAIVLSTNKTHSTSRRNRSFSTYAYQATVQFRQQKREIAITEAEYGTRTKGDRLQVLYSSALNDLMSVHYVLPPEVYIIPLLFWGILLLGVWLTLNPRKRKRLSAARA